MDNYILYYLFEYDSTQNRVVPLFLYAKIKNIFPCDSITNTGTNSYYDNYKLMIKAIDEMTLLNMMALKNIEL